VLNEFLASAQEPLGEDYEFFQGGREDMLSSAVRAARMLGVLNLDKDEWFQGGADAGIESRIGERTEAKKNRDFATADRIRDELKSEGIVLEDGPGGTTWRRE